MQKRDEQQSDEGFKAAALITGYMQGSLSRQERNDLKNWLNSSEQNRQLFLELCSAEAVEKDMASFEQTDTGAGWERLQQKLAGRPTGKQKHGSRYDWRWVAAASIVILLATWQLLEHSGGGKPTKPILASEYGQDALPGTNKARLILSDGSSLVLEDGADSLFMEKGIAVQRNSNGSLLYSNQENSEAMAWNELEIPNGGEYKLVLADGSKVWLNAASKIRYPVQFAGPERRIELLKGEAYFEVAKNKEKPFIVVANRMQVQAIGTAFNINTYTNADSGVSTTLTEGRVSVGTSAGAIMLQPGLQLKMNAAGNAVVQADVEAVTGWKNGLFVFNYTPLDEVMNQVARWYDVQVQYDRRFTTKPFFTGEIKRNLPLSQLLQMMELTGIARFKIQNRILAIYPY